MVIERLVNDLRSLGLGEGDHVLVHSSLKSLGDIEERAMLFVEAMKRVLGDEGTLLMPSLSYKTVTRENPVFDELATPSCVGGLTEYFRTSGDVLRSIHPTHSVCAWGRKAQWFIQDHLKDHTPCGPYSPFSKLNEVGGYVMFLGCSPRFNTSMHGVEEKTVPPYLFGTPIEYTLKMADTTVVKKEYITHDFEGYEQRYERLLPLLNKEEFTQGRVLQADTCLIQSRAIWQKGHDRLVEDPLYFVDRV